jgi:hypothetical protein
VHRHLALLSLFARADVQHAVTKIDVVAVESDCFARTHPSDRQQPDQRLMTRRAQRGSEPASGCHQRRDLGVGIDVGREALARDRQQVAAGNLTGGVDRRQIPSEPARDRQPLTPAGRMSVNGQPRPRERQLGGDPLSARPLEKLDESFEQPTVLRHLEPQPAADAQIVGERFAQPGHAAPPSCDGHGRASARSALRSTLA